MEKTKPKNNKVLLFLTPLFMLIICISIAIMIFIVPYDKFSSYLNLVFIDKFKLTQSSNQSIELENKNIVSFETKNNFSETGEVIIPKFAQQYATLTCENIDLFVPIYWGSTSELLKKGACQSTNSVIVGEKGNVVISAHVNTFFESLNKIEIGDKAVLNTSYGEFTYQAVEKIKFKNTNKKYVLPTEEDKLTLYTCIIQVLGTSDEREGVVFDLVEKKFFS